MEKVISKKEVTEKIVDALGELQKLAFEVSGVKMENFKLLESRIEYAKELFQSMEEACEKAVADTGKYCECGSGNIADRWCEVNDEPGCPSCKPALMEAS